MKWEYLGKIIYQDDKIIVKSIGHTKTERILSITIKNGEENKDDKESNQV